MPETDRKPIRWWPTALILALYAALEAWIWLRPGITRQMRFIPSYAASFLAVVLLLLWFIFFSRARRKWRWLAVGLVAAVLVFLQQFVTIRGVTGDLFPILGWKGGSGAVAEGSFSGGRVAGVADYPQFLGPSRNATVADAGLHRDWESEPPKEIWRRPVGEGWSGFAVLGDWAVTQEQHGEDESVVAYDLRTGEERWRHSDKIRYETTIAGIGPRSTPTLDGGRVYTLGGTGFLNALDLETGERLWSHDLHTENGTTNLEWGRSCSPLVIDDLVVASAGGPGGRSLVAYRAETGELAWSAGDDRAGYSSPIEATLGGRRQIVIFNQSSVAGHDPATGDVLWTFDWPAEQPNVAIPLVLSNDRLLVSSGYGIGSKVLRIAANGDRQEASLVWESPRLKAKFTNVVLHKGKVYGLDDGVFVCIDPETGERCWKRGRYGHGQAVLSGGLLVLMAEKGDVVLLEPVAEEHRELGRFTAFDRKTWNPPALAGNLLLVRNDREAVLFELPAG